MVCHIAMNRRWSLPRQEDFRNARNFHQVMGLGALVEYDRVVTLYTRFAVFPQRPRITSLDKTIHRIS